VSVQEKNEEKINSEKHEISQLTSILKDNKQELEFLKDHGSNNQLSSMSSRYFRTFDLAALICFIINDFFCFSNF
jgi:hypothetical protein